MRRDRSGPAAPIAVASLVGALCSVIGVTGRSLGFDEGATVAIASQHGHALWHGIAHDGGNMSGYYLLIHLLIGAFGDSEWVLRLPSVLAAAATAGLVAALAQMLFDRRVAWVASLLCAVSLPIVYWGQTVRGYAPMLAFATLGMLAFVGLVRAAERGGGRVWAWAALYVVAMGLGAYCSFVAVLVVPAQIVAALWRPRAWRPLLAALVVLALSGIPLAILAVRRGSGQLFWVPRPNRQIEDQVLQSLTGSGLESSFRATFVTIGGWVLTMLVVVALLVLAIRAWRAGPATRPEPLTGWPVALVLLWALLAPVLVFLAGLAGERLFEPRNLLASVPAVALALAVAICDRRLPRWAAATGLVLAFVIRVVPLAAAYDVSPEPWQQVTAEVLAQTRPGDCVTFYPEDGRNPFRYYAARSAALSRAPRTSSCTGHSRRPGSPRCAAPAPACG
jgi:mannosyltransferase